jgi:hypothetical protein
VVHQPCSTQRYQQTQRYRRITILLREADWNVGKDRVERIWHREGLQVPQEAEATWPLVAQ